MSEFIYLIIGSLLSLWMTHYYFVQGIKSKEPVYSKINNTLVSEEISTFDNLKIYYREKLIKNLTVSKMVVFNQGKEVINREDINTSNHIRIITSSNKVKLLHVSIIQSNKEGNQFTIKLNRAKNEAVLHFDYLGYRDGVVIQIIHTGVEPEGIDLTGDIKSVSNIKEVPFYQLDVFDEKAIEQDQNNRFAVSGLISLGWLIILVMGYLPNYFATLKSDTVYLVIYSVGMVLLGLFTLGSILGLVLIKLNSGIQLPKGLEIFKSN